MVPTLLLGPTEDLLTKQSVIGDSDSQTAVEAMSAQPQDFRGIGEEGDVHADPEVEKMRKEMIRIMDVFLGQKDKFLAQKVELGQER